MNKKTVSILLTFIAAFSVLFVVGYKLATAENKEKKYRKLTEGLDEEDELEMIDLDVQDDIYNEDFSDMAEAH